MSKVMECLEQNIQKQINCETKLLGNTKHNQVKLVLAVFVSAYLYQYSIKFIKQTRYN